MELAHSLADPNKVYLGNGTDGRLAVSRSHVTPWTRSMPAPSSHAAVRPHPISCSSGVGSLSVAAEFHIGPSLQNSTLVLFRYIFRGAHPKLCRSLCILQGSDIWHIHHSSQLQAQTCPVFISTSSVILFLKDLEEGKCLTFISAPSPLTHQDSLFHKKRNANVPWDFLCLCSFL